MKRLLFATLAALGFAAAASEGDVTWDKFPKERMTNVAALQSGAQLFVNYCLNCHSAGYMRFNRLGDLGLSESQIKGNLLFTTDKVGETMKVALDPKQAKEWFGAVPPDLTVIARSRSDISKGSGADYLYTYLRSYYRDPGKATGWNNLAFPNVGMPHALWELQGQRSAKFVDVKDAHDPSKMVHRFEAYETITAGRLSPREYDETVADLVAYLQWMGEPAQGQRVRVGVWVLIYLGLFIVIAWRLNASYWKDVK
jgi:ubiquinol-cytochrome c reductase cytochrome c1 subunit